MGTRIRRNTLRERERERESRRRNAVKRAHRKIHIIGGTKRTQEIIKNRSLGKDGAFQQQIFGKNQRRRLFTSRERRTKRRRFRRNPVVRGRRMGRSSVVLLGIRV